jgi:hypothetical protein
MQFCKGCDALPPQETLPPSWVGDVLLLAERSDGILLRPVDAGVPKLSFEETAIETAASDEDWSDWDATLADALDAVPWEHPPSALLATG